MGGEEEKEEPQHTREKGGEEKDDLAEKVTSTGIAEATEVDSKCEVMMSCWKAIREGEISEIISERRSYGSI